MIDNKQVLKEYLLADKIANAKTTKHPKPGGDLTWRFLIALRQLEYQINCNHGVFRRLMILQNCKVENCVTLGANAVVSKDISQEIATWVGVPARKIR